MAVGLSTTWPVPLSRLAALTALVALWGLVSFISMGAVAEFETETGCKAFAAVSAGGDPAVAGPSCARLMAKVAPDSSSDRTFCEGLSLVPGVCRRSSSSLLHFSSSRAAAPVKGAAVGAGDVLAKPTSLATFEGEISPAAVATAEEFGDGGVVSRPLFSGLVLGRSGANESDAPTAGWAEDGGDTVEAIDRASVATGPFSDAMGCGKLQAGLD